MALVPSSVGDGPVFAEVDMGTDSSAPTVRATVVQASTIFYDTPATLGLFCFHFQHFINLFVFLSFTVLVPDSTCSAQTTLEVIYLYLSFARNIQIAVRGHCKRHCACVDRMALKVYGNSYSSAIAWFLYTSVDLEVSGRENENAIHFNTLGCKFC